MPLPSFPISEIFASVQGEGAWVGAPMTFIRLAGCCVGVPYKQEEKVCAQLQLYQEKCTSWDGTEFACDTDFRVHERMTVEDITRVPEVVAAKRVCITGGEPLIHDIRSLIHQLSKYVAPSCIHLETSGVRLLPLTSQEMWVAVSPKSGCLREMLDRANEIKILIGPSFDEEKFVVRYNNYLKKIFFQPINDLDTVDKVNYEHCVRLALKYGARVSVQLHKLLGVR